MSIFDTLSKKINEAGTGASYKAKTMTEIMKLNSSISQCRTVINSLKRDIGSKYVDAHLEDPNAEFIFEISQIKEEIKKIEECEKRLEQLKTPVPTHPLVQSPVLFQTQGSVCPKCGALVSEDMIFCMNCGFKLPKVEQLRRCPKCGIEVPGNAKFCISCGVPMGADQTESDAEIHSGVIESKDNGNEETEIYMANE